MNDKQRTAWCLEVSRNGEYCKGALAYQDRIEQLEDEVIIQKKLNLRRAQDVRNREAVIADVRKLVDTMPTTSNEAQAIVYRVNAIIKRGE